MFTLQLQPLIFSSEVPQDIIILKGMATFIYTIDKCGNCAPLQYISQVIDLRAVI